MKYFRKYNKKSILYPHTKHFRCTNKYIIVNVYIVKIGVTRFELATS